MKASFLFVLLLLSLFGRSQWKKHYTSFCTDFYPTLFSAEGMHIHRQFEIQEDEYGPQKYLFFISGESVIELEVLQEDSLVTNKNICYQDYEMQPLIGGVHVHMRMIYKLGNLSSIALSDGMCQYILLIDYLKDL